MSAIPIPALPSAKSVNPVQPIPAGSAQKALKGQLEDLLRFHKLDTPNMKQQVEQLINGLSGAIDQAVSKPSQDNLDGLKQSIYMNLGRVSLGPLHRNQEIVVTVIMTTVHLLIRIGNGALLE